ncbi:PIN domain-containing protein [Phenylobacterium sp.]|uniref:PIN domain-containing protein n=1 Tax=Phenylobacterium sp. TaxID=1871053 RepID=UPI0025E62D65|nr:PIN domain-containing protein [Phenylobacterium sp.]MBX3482380.1 PIN domain-containing protein [Phenylobacterium sp.]MCW5557935.1 PIN domain-containing protein [Verrucomicrobiae bacterium]
MLRLCLDLNVWVGAFLAEKYGRQDTAAQSLVEAIRLGQSPRGPVALVISWGMLFRLNAVILRLTGDQAVADRLMGIIATLARDGPSPTVGGVGVLPLDDEEDRHVLETALTGEADLLVTQNLNDFIQGDVDRLDDGHWYGLSRDPPRKLLIAHTYGAAAWLRGEPWPEQVEAYIASVGRPQG